MLTIINKTRYFIFFGGRKNALHTFRLGIMFMMNEVEDYEKGA